MRYPLEPLAAALRIDLGQVGGHRHDTDQLTGMALLAARIGVGHRTATRARQHGLTDRQADHWATRVGLHPSMVWPTWSTNLDSEEATPGWFTDDNTDADDDDPERALAHAS